jgi:hypothetical protein
MASVREVLEGYALLRPAGTRQDSPNRTLTGAQLARRKETMHMIETPYAHDVDARRGRPWHLTSGLRAIALT